MSDQRILYGEFDAAIWAAEFIEIHPDTVDEDDMRGWFANAIMTGYDIAKREALSSPPPDQPSETASKSAIDIVDICRVEMYEGESCPTYKFDDDEAVVFVEAYAARKVEEVRANIDGQFEAIRKTFHNTLESRREECEAKDAEIARLKAQVQELEDIGRGLIHWDNNGRATTGTILFERLRAALASTADGNDHGL